MEPAVLAVGAPQVDLGVDGPLIAGGHGPALRQVGHLIGMERGVVGQERATGRVTPRVLSPAGVGVEDATCSVGPPGDERDRVGQVAISAIVAIGRVTDIHSRIGRPGRGSRILARLLAAGCHRSAGRGAAGSRLLEQEGRYGRWRAPRNRPCNDVTSPDWYSTGPAILRAPDNRHRRRRGNVVCMSRLSISVHSARAGSVSASRCSARWPTCSPRSRPPGSAGTSLEQPCSRPHWGFVIDGELTFVGDDRREIIPAGRAFHVPAGGREHWFEARGPALVAGFEPIEPDARRERRTARGPGLRRRRSGRGRDRDGACRPSRPARSPPARSGPRPGRWRRTS